MVAIVNVTLDEFLRDYETETIPSAQKNLFIWLISMITVLSLIGNIAAFCVNIKRKIRPFYRTCLLSLAFSDLLTTITSETSFIAQLLAFNTNIWLLGDFLCDLIPFLYTFSMILNSLTLISLTIVRYMAVKKVLINMSCDPGVCCCVCYIILTYGVAIALSFPLIAVFHTKKTILIITNPADRDDVLDEIIIDICIAGTSSFNSQLFYLVVYGVLMTPIIIMFLILNGSIARDMWRKRKVFYKSKSKTLPIHNLTIFGGSASSASKTKSLPVVCKKYKSPIASENPSFDSLNSNIRLLKSTQQIYASNQAFIHFHLRNSFDDVYNQATYLRRETSNKSQKQKHKSQLCAIIVILMLVFLICRMPKSLFVVLYLNTGSLTVSEWIFHYAFEILSLTSCVLNPLFYTFMPETIKMLTKLCNCSRRVGSAIRMHIRYPACLNISVLGCCKEKNIILERDENTKESYISKH